MSVMEVNNLTHGYADQTLYKSVSFSLNRGEHMGVVGQNGVGKSTLVKLLTGEMLPWDGRVDWIGKVSVGHIDQYAEVDAGMTVLSYLHTAFQPLYDLEAQMIAMYEAAAADSNNEKALVRASALQERLLIEGFYAVDSTVNKVITGLGIAAIGTDRILAELSGGQRAKIILAKLLLEAPDVLLLDEPTNFLDASHIDWLADELTSFKGAFVVVSHDNAFLSRICNCILEIEFNKMSKFHGTFDSYVRQKAQRDEDYAKQYSAQKKYIEKQEEFIRRNIAGVNTRNAQGRRKQLEHLERLEAPEKKPIPKLSFTEASCPPQQMLVVKKLEVGYKKPLLPSLDFTVGYGEKVVVTGFNGIGKSTLLKTLLGVIPRLGGDFHFALNTKIGYFAQELTWDDGARTPIQLVSDEHKNLTPQQIRRRLSQCGVQGETALQGVKTLSGGEQAKVKLCCLLLRPCNFLVLDEPTNHLDVDTKAELVRALKAFKGCVLLVSHEAEFYKDVADRVLDIEKLLYRGKSAAK